MKSVLTTGRNTIELLGHIFKEGFKMSVYEEGIHDKERVCSFKNNL